MNEWMKELEFRIDSYDEVISSKPTKNLYWTVQ